VALLDTFEAEQQPLELVLPRFHRIKW
jgi:hypothetical protein